MPEKTDKMKWFLVIATTLGVFGIIGLLFFQPVPDAVENVLFAVVGTILGKWGTMVDFNFGSSSGSARKSDMLNELAGTGDGTSKVTTNATIETKKVTTITPDTPVDPLKKP